VKHSIHCLVVIVGALGQIANAQTADARRDSFPHAVRFVSVEKNVTLEVLDWGGRGRPLVFLSGLGDDAHVLDAFAANFRATNHVVGITRRGFGASSAPAPVDSNYSADRLGDDVLAVIDSLALARPVIVGHSIGGEELSSIGSRHPEKVAGLVYLDAVWPYSYYDRSVGNMRLDALELKRTIDDLLSPITARQRMAVAKLETDLPRFERVLQDFQRQLAEYPATPPGPLPPQPLPTIVDAVSLGWRKYTNIPVPILAIVAVPHSVTRALKNDSVARAKAIAADSAKMSVLGDGFAAGIPTARVVRLANANHYIFNSNEKAVVAEMNAFLATLP
jgi:non-heme chloroperoxidase